MLSKEVLKRPAVIDTMIVVRANADLDPDSAPSQRFRLRVALLSAAVRRELKLIVSKKLISEYRNKVSEPFSDFIMTFWALLDSEDVIWNWVKEWGGPTRDAFAKCLFPNEDAHLLRAAIMGDITHLITEEGRIISSRDCVARLCKVRIKELR